jgi:hypothetical protein
MVQVRQRGIEGMPYHRDIGDLVALGNAIEGRMGLHEASVAMPVERSKDFVVAVGD